MTSVQIIWLCSVAVILIALVVIGARAYHIHPLRYLSKHHFFGIETYDFLYNDDDCDE